MVPSHSHTKTWTVSLGMPRVLDQATSAVAHAATASARGSRRVRPVVGAATVSGAVPVRLGAMAGA